MRFEWDERKSRTNCAKHKVSFETAILVFEDPFALSVQDRVIAGSGAGKPWVWWVAWSSCWWPTRTKERVERN